MTFIKYVRKPVKTWPAVIKESDSVFVTCSLPYLLSESLSWVSTVSVCSNVLCRILGVSGKVDRQKWIQSKQTSWRTGVSLNSWVPWFLLNLLWHWGCKNVGFRHQKNHRILWYRILSDCILCIERIFFFYGLGGNCSFAGKKMYNIQSWYLLKVREKLLIFGFGVNLEKTYSVPAPHNCSTV